MQTNKYTEKKYHSHILHNIYRYLHSQEPHVNRYLDRAEKAYDCSKFLTLATNKTTNKTRVLHAKHCDLRLCPICSIRTGDHHNEILNDICSKKEMQNKRLIMLSLTQKNVSFDKLKDEISRMQNAWRNLVKDCKKYKKISLGYMKKLEITVNKNTREMHPHFHILLVVDSNYSQYNPDYISQEEWSNLWRKYMQITDENDPIVHVQFAYTKDENGNKNYDDFTGAIKEICKYITKGYDYLDFDKDDKKALVLSTEIVRTLDYALHNRRLFEYGGLLRKLKDKLSKSDEPEQEINEEKIDNEVIHHAIYLHVKRKYVSCSVTRILDKIDCGLSPPPSFFCDEKFAS
jgi:plasmid rolling circle replication initiator protein Rep